MAVTRDVGNLVAAAVAGLLAGCSQASSPHLRSRPAPSARPTPARAEPALGAPAGQSQPLVGSLVRAEHGALVVARLGAAAPGERGQVFVRDVVTPSGWQLVGNGVVESVDGGLTRIGLRDPDGELIDGAVLDVPAGAEVKLERRRWTADPTAAHFICCKARNDCKGLGNCKTETNDCKGRNECKGRGGCAPVDCPGKR